MNKQNIFTIIFFLIILVVVYFFVFNNNPSSRSTRSQKTYDQKTLTKLAQCLTANKVVMYGAYWCPHCQKQKKNFGDSFKYIKYVECTKETKLCADKKIEGYPTWVFKNDKRIEGEASFEDLAKTASCKL